LVYLKSSFERFAWRPDAISNEDAKVYADAYSQAGAMRCGFDVYRAFERDAEESREWLKEKGKSGVPALSLSGERSLLRGWAEEADDGGLCGC
jgi:hypothetical protein